MKSITIFFLILLSTVAGADTCFKLNSAIEDERFELPPRFCISEVNLSYEGNLLMAKFALDGVTQSQEVTVEDATNEGQLFFKAGSLDYGSCEEGLNWYIMATLTNTTEVSPQIVSVESAKAVTARWPDTCHSKYPTVNEANYIRE